MIVLSRTVKGEEVVVTATCQARCEGAEGFSRDAFYAVLQAIMDEQAGGVQRHHGR